MYNFAKFVDRQAQTFDGPVRPIVFCVLRQTPLSAALRDALSRKVIDHRPLEFPPLADSEQEGECHVFFSSSPDRKHLCQILNEVKSLNVLTVGEVEDFVREGGIVWFVLGEGRVRLDLILDAADDAKLLMKSKLLTLARIVRRADK
jgi:hypothetical protein